MKPFDTVRIASGGHREGDIGVIAKRSNQGWLVVFDDGERQWFLAMYLEVIG